MVKRDTGYANQRERAATLMWKESDAWRHRSWIKWKRHQHRGVKATNRRRGSQINLAHLKQYGHGVLAISRLLPGESEAGNLSGIRLRCHHWQTMGSWYLRYNQFKSLKRKTDSILFFFFSDSDNIRDRVLPFSRGLEIERTGRNPCLDSTQLRLLMWNRAIRFNLLNLITGLWEELNYFLCRGLIPRLTEELYWIKVILV